MVSIVMYRRYLTVFTQILPPRVFAVAEGGAPWARLGRAASTFPGYYRWLLMWQLTYGEFVNVGSCNSVSPGLSCPGIVDVRWQSWKVVAT